MRRKACQKRVESTPVQAPWSRRYAGRADLARPARSAGRRRDERPWRADPSRRAPAVRRSQAHGLRFAGRSHPEARRTRPRQPPFQEIVLTDVLSPPPLARPLVSWLGKNVDWEHHYTCPRGTTHDTGKRPRPAEQRDSPRPGGRRPADEDTLAVRTAESERLWTPDRPDQQERRPRQRQPGPPKVPAVTRGRW